MVFWRTSLLPVGTSPGGMPDINSSSSQNGSDEEPLHDQRHLGKPKIVVDPGAYEAASKATASAEADNEKAFENIARAKEKQGLIDTDDYKAFVRNHYVPGRAHEPSHEARRSAVSRWHSHR